MYKSTRRIQSIKKRLPKTKKITAEIEKFIKEKIEVDVSVTLRQLKNDILIEKDIQLSMSTINRAIKEFNYTLKSWLPKCSQMHFLFSPHKFGKIRFQEMSCCSSMSFIAPFC